jgi:hypothetical protein
MPMLFDLARPLDDLENLLLEEFSGRTLTMKEIFDEHHVGHPYLPNNYKEALKSLDKKGKIKAVPGVTKRNKNTFADRVKVQFPAEKKT